MDPNTNSPTPSSPERGSLGTGDLASKYTRLATEYSKVRAQLNVLKKAIIEEKNSKQQITEVLRENETKSRKFEAEMDALTFRNAQLTKRVEILQQESENNVNPDTFHFDEFFLQKIQNSNSMKKFVKLKIFLLIFRELVKSRKMKLQMTSIL